MAISIVARGVNGMALPILSHSLKLGLQHWWFALGAVLLTAVQFFPEALLWQREKILDGEFWRLVTGHWLHLNVSHFGLNVAAGMVVIIWIKPHVRTVDIALHLFLFSLLLGLCLLLFVPQLGWYAGLSGVLYGFLCLYSIRLFFSQGSRWWAAAFLLIWLKITFEQFAKLPASMALLNDFPVVVEAHLIGAILGTLIAVVQVLFIAACFRE